MTDEEKSRKLSNVSVLFAIAYSLIVIPVLIVLVAKACWIRAPNCRLAVNVACVAVLLLFSVAFFALFFLPLLACGEFA
jgi:hypothetical protein